MATKSKNYGIRNGLTANMAFVTCGTCESKIEFKPRFHKLATCECGKICVDCDSHYVRYIGDLPKDHVNYQKK